MIVKIPNLRDYAPPGAELEKERNIAIFMAALFIVGLSFSFPFSYFSAREELYLYHLDKRVLIEGAVMKPLGELMRRCFAGFWIFMVFCLLSAIRHYRSFYEGSKSIYVMKRLESALELHIRCLSLPAMYLALGTCLVLALMGLYTLLYCLATPAACLPRDIGFDFWGSLL